MKTFPKTNSGRTPPLSSGAVYATDLKAMATTSGYHD